MLEDTFGDIIGKARFGNGWSLADLARRCNLSERRIEALEGGAQPTRNEIELLSASLGLDPGKLAVIARSAWEPKPVGIEWADTIQRIDGRIGDYPVNGYLFIDADRRGGVLFDTGYSPDRVIQILKEEKIRLAALCITHAHADHIGGAQVIQSATSAPIYLHPNELSAERKRPKEVLLLQEEMEIPFGHLRIRSLRTPGHTPGGTTFLIKAPPGWVAFVGDALFAGSLGRAQSPSTYSTLLHSVRTAILSLPKETVLFPGHGPATTVEEEQRHNPFFRSAS